MIVRPFPRLRPLSPATHLLSSLLLAAVSSLGCSGGGTVGDGDGDRGGDTDASTTGLSGSTTTGSSGSTTGDDAGTSGSTSGFDLGGLPSTTGDSTGETGSTTGADSSEVCDGVDNDGNGIIDDVDAGGDGICDCLRIGTLGTIGPWSDGGNIFRDWLDERSPTPAVELGHGTLSAEVLADLDILVLLRVDEAELSANGITDPPHPSFTTEEIEAFDAWVRAGGGALTTLGYQGDEMAELVNINNLLSLTSPAYAEDPNLNGFITDWGTHPIAEGISNINNSNGVVVDDSSGTVVARDNEGHPAMVAHEVDAGHVIVWGDEWITYDSEWVSQEDQQVELLWLNMLKWLSPIRTCQVPIPDDIIR